MTGARRLLRGDIGRYGLKPPEALVLLALDDRADADGIAWPSQQSIADALGMSREGVARIIGRLIAAGVIEIHERGRQHRSTRYRITLRRDPRSRLDERSDVIPTKHLESPSDVIDDHTKYLNVTEHGLPNPVRSAAARRSDSRALRAAENEDDDQVCDAPGSGAKRSTLPPEGDGRGRPRQTTQRDPHAVPARPQYARGGRRDDARRETR